MASLHRVECSFHFLLASPILTPYSVSILYYHTTQHYVGMLYHSILYSTMLIYGMESPIDTARAQSVWGSHMSKSKWGSFTLAQLPPCTALGYHPILAPLVTNLYTSSCSVSILYHHPILQYVNTLPCHPLLQYVSILYYHTILQYVSILYCTWLAPYILHTVSNQY